MDEMKARYQDTLFRKSKELAMSLKHSDKSEEALKKEFEVGVMLCYAMLCWLT